VRIALGLLLLTAAGLKLAGRGVSAVPQVGWFATPTIQVAAAEWEIVLGIWLLSGAYQIGAWFASLATFLSFAAISAYLGRIGVSSCGCFGAIHASPWYAFGLDLIAIAVIGAFWPGVRPEIRGARYLQPPPLSGVCMLFAIVLLVGSVVGSLALYYGSVDAALARLRGDPVSVSETFVDLGHGTAGQFLQGTIELRNFTDDPIRVIGGTSDCQCAIIRDLPLTLEPNRATHVSIVMRIPAHSPHILLTHRAEFLTDHPRQPKVSFLLACRRIETQ
jgi:hypothetical protein